MVRVIALTDHREYHVPLDGNGVGATAPTTTGDALIAAVAAAVDRGADTFTLLTTSGREVRGDDTISTADDATTPFMLKWADKADAPTGARDTPADATVAGGEKNEGGSNAAGVFLNMAVDITPDVDLLVHSGDDYDLVTACAELVDNSIQNTLGQADRQINIVFKRPSPTCPPEKIVVFDNGRGMSIEGLKQWAVLGRTSHRQPHLREPIPPTSVNGTPVTPLHTADISTPAHRPPPIDSSDAEKTWSFRCERRLSDYLSSDFSRYGVGSKKAIFSLGDTVIVTSKTRASPWVGELTLSRDSIKKEGWRTHLHARHPTPDEEKLGSFTSFTIEHLKQTFQESYIREYMATCMAHIYHYYLWGPKGNSVKGGSHPASSSPIDAANDPEGELTTDRGRQFVPVDLRVDGVSVTRARGDPESLLLQTGAERVTFDVVIGVDEVRSCEQTPMSLMRAAPTRVDAKGALTQAPGGDDFFAGGLSQPGAGGGGVSPCETAPSATIVKVVLFYFPFRDGAETMPIPAGLAGLGDDINDERVPLCDRKSGLEVFWNGRLLPREFLDAWPLLRSASSKKDDDIPAACFRRVKGMVFLDAAFEVTANKHTLVREAPLAKALMQHQNRFLNQNIRRWVRHCHRTHDEELIFGEPDPMLMKGDGVVYYKSVKVTNMMIAKGGHILSKQPTGRGKVIGKVAAIFTDHKLSEAVHGCQLRVRVGFSSAAVQGSEMIIPVGLVQRVLSAEEAAAEVKKAKKTSPTRLMIEGLPTTMCACDDLARLPLMNLTIANEDNKAIARVPATLEVSITAVPARGACVDQANTFIAQHKFARATSFTLKLSDFRDMSCPDFLRFAGKYTFAFRCSIPTVATLEHVLNVTGDFTSIGGIQPCPTAAPSLGLTIDKPAPSITLVLKDTLGNAVPFASLPKDLQERCVWGARFASEEGAVAAAGPEKDGKKEDKDGGAKDASATPLTLNTAELKVKSAPMGVVLEGCVAHGLIPPLSSEWCAADEDARAATQKQLDESGVAACSAPTLPPVVVTLKVTPAAKAAPGANPFAARAMRGTQQQKGATQTQDPATDAVTCVTCRLPVDQLLPGNMHALLLKAPPSAVGWKSTFRVDFHVVDKYSNPAQPPAGAKGELLCGLKLEGCAVFQEPDCVKGIALSNGSVFRFDRVAIARPPDQPVPTEAVFVTLKAVCFYQLKGNKTRATPLQVSCDVELKPPSSYPHLSLEKVLPAGLGLAPVAATPLATVITAEVGDTLRAMEAVFVNPPAWIASAKLKCSWGEDSTAAIAFTAPTDDRPQYRAALPPLQAPQKATRVNHTLTAYKDGCESDMVEHKVTIVYVLGPPCAWKVVNHPEQVQVRQAFGVTCRAQDKFGNDLPCNDPRLKGAKITLSIVKGGGEETAFVDDDLWETKQRDTTWSLQKVKIAGKTGELMLCVTSSTVVKPEPQEKKATQQQQQQDVTPLPSLKSKPFKVSVVAGDAIATTLDGQIRTTDSPLELALENFSTIAGMKVGLVDEYGNGCAISHGSRQARLIFDAAGDVKMSKAPNATKERVFDTRFGIFTPQMLAWTKPFSNPKADPAKSLAYVTVDTAAKSVSRGCLALTVRPGKLPWSATLTTVPVTTDVGTTAARNQGKAGKKGRGKQEGAAEKEAEAEKETEAEQPLPRAIEILAEVAGDASASVAAAAEPVSKKAKKDAAAGDKGEAETGGEGGAKAAEGTDVYRNVRCGEPLGEVVEVLIRSENGAPCGDMPSDRVALILTSPSLPSSLVFNGPVPSSQQPQALIPDAASGKPAGRKRKAASAAVTAPQVAPIRFNELASFAPVIAGLYTGKVELDLMYHPARDQLEKIKALKRRINAFSFSVTAAAPSLLKGKVVRATAVSGASGGGASTAAKSKRRAERAKAAVSSSTWGTSHHLGGVAPEKALFETLELRVEDQYGNLCAEADLALRVVVCGYADTSGPVEVPRAPSIDGSCDVPITSGVAQIPELRLTRNIHEAPEGLYCVTFKVVDAAGNPQDGVLDEVVVLPFQYTDDSVKQRQVQALADRKAEWVKVQHHIKKKLAKFKQARAVHQEAEAKWDARINDLRQDIIRTKKFRHPNWETFDAGQLAKQTADALAAMRDQENAKLKDPKHKPRNKEYFARTHDGLKKIADGRSAADSGVVGVIGEVGYVKEEAVDKCISRAVGRMMQCVVFDNGDALRRWKQRLRDLPAHQNLPMLALDQTTRCELDDDGKIESLRIPQPRPAGWVGYAANLIELDDKNMYLRPCFYQLIGNKAVFDTIDNARAWRKSLTERRQRAPPIICLDGEKMESTGVEWAGQVRGDDGYRFGQMPYFTTERYKAIQRLHTYLLTYQELLQEREAEREGRAPVDPNGEEPKLLKELQDITERLHAITRLLEGGVERTTVPALQAQLDAPLPPMSQAIADLPDPDSLRSQGAGKRKRQGNRSPTPPDDTDSDGSADPFRFEVSQARAGKRRRT